MKIIIPIFLLACMFAVGGCYFKGKASDLVGIYQAELPDRGLEQLELLSDGRCLQKIQLANGETYMAQGTWKWNYSPDRNRGSSYIIFSKIRSPLYAGKIRKDLANEPGNGIIARPVYRGIFGSIKIMFREGHYYEKIK